MLQLQDELTEARRHFTPEMHHYKMLQSKIASMESRHSSREHELRALLDNARSRGVADIAHVEDKWRHVLRDKDAELTKFREELDTILEVLRELKRQGIILPITASDSNYAASTVIPGSSNTSPKQLLLF